LAIAEIRAGNDPLPMSNDDCNAQFSKHAHACFINESNGNRHLMM